MIKINLLPVEKRKAERTPLPRFGLILADIAVAAVVIVAILFEWIMIKRTEGEKAGLEARLVTLKPDIAHFKASKQLNGELHGKLGEIRSIAGQGNEWWRILDGLWEVINDNTGVWIDDINSADGSAAAGMIQSWDPGRAQEPPPFGLTMSCHSAGLDTKAMTKFRADLREHAVLKRFFTEINFSIDWSVEPQDDFQQRYSLQFRITMIGRVPPPPAAGGPQP